MARALMEAALAPEDLDNLFEAHAESQYTRKILFSSMVDLMGVVVSKNQPSIRAAFEEVKATLPASLSAFYGKLNGIEPAVTSALVQHSAQKLASVVVSMNGQVSALLPGYRTRIIDGSHLAGTHRLLDVLKKSQASPLPGHSLVILDPALMLATDMIPCEVGHAQERTLFTRENPRLCRGGLRSLTIPGVEMAAVLSAVTGSRSNAETTQGIGLR